MTKSKLIFHSLSIILFCTASINANAQFNPLQETYTYEQLKSDSIYYIKKGISVYERIESERNRGEIYVMDEREKKLSDRFKEMFINDWINSGLADETGITIDEVKEILKNTKVLIGIGAKQVEELKGESEGNIVWLNYIKYAGSQSNSLFHQHIAKMYRGTARHELAHIIFLYGKRKHILPEEEAEWIARRLNYEENGVNLSYNHEFELICNIIDIIGAQNYFDCTKNGKGLYELKELFENKQDIIGFDIIYRYFQRISDEYKHDNQNDEARCFEQLHLLSKDDWAQNQGHSKISRLIEDVLQEKTVAEKERLKEQVRYFEDIIQIDRLNICEYYKQSKDSVSENFSNWDIFKLFRHAYIVEETFRKQGLDVELAKKETDYEFTKMVNEALNTNSFFMIKEIAFVLEWFYNKRLDKNKTKIGETIEQILLSDGIDKAKEFLLKEMENIK
jgi:hypothetical protein